MIHNDVKLPHYIRSLLRFKKYSRGLVIETNYRKNNYSNQLVTNKIHDTWNDTYTVVAIRLYPYFYDCLMELGV